MNSLLSLFFLTVLLFNTIQATSCDFSDDVCMTKIASKYYSVILAGFEEPSDPLHVEKIEQGLADFKFSLHDVTLVGMNDCKVLKLSCRPKKLTFDFFLRCPRLVLTSNFETEGALASIPIDAKGDIKIIADDYVIMYTGAYGKSISEVDQKPRVFIKSYDVDIDVKGKVTFEIPNLLTGDKEQLDVAIKFMNENWIEMEKLTRQPIKDGLFRTFFDRYSDVLKSVPLNQLLTLD